MKWETLSSEYLFNDMWFKVRKDVCRTPQGKIVEPYYVYEFPDWVSAVALTEEGKVVMVKQYRHAVGEVCLEIPGGCVDDTDADLETAVSRELQEETGYSFTNYRYLGKISSNPSTNNNMMHMFLATGGRKTSPQSLDQNEEIEVELYTIDQVKELIRDNKIIQSMHVTCFLYAFAELGKLEY